eukprot:2642510-Pleurochrysis_carterae.AAC.1
MAGLLTPPDLRSSYQSLVGALLYCSTQTRPDVAYAVGMLCRTMSCPMPVYLTRRIACYATYPTTVTW